MNKDDDINKKIEDKKDESIIDELHVYTIISKITNSHNLNTC